MQAVGPMTAQCLFPAVLFVPAHHKNAASTWELRWYQVEAEQRCARPGPAWSLQRLLPHATGPGLESHLRSSQPKTWQQQSSGQGWHDALFVAFDKKFDKKTLGRSEMDSAS